MDESLYDEFGNYIGPELEDDRDSEEEEERWEDEEDGVRDDMDTDDEGVQDEVEDRRIVLHEDKNYYASAEEVFPGAEALVEDEDTQPLTEPIIKPIKEKRFSSLDDLPAHTFTKEFMCSLMHHPDLIRNVAVVGSIHHGKTLLLDLLIQQTHEKKWNLSKSKCYTDTLLLEQERKLSIKSTPMSLLLQNSKEKSFLVNFIDTPGHVNFSDEVTASLRLVDGVVLVVDVVEGVLLQTKRIIQECVRLGLSMVLLLNKLDRLILELKLPPNEAFYKIRHAINQVNRELKECTPLDRPVKEFSPVVGNVCFSSTLMGWIFSLDSFAQTYSNSHGNCFPYEELAARLWGDVWYLPQKRRFTRKAPSSGSNRTFVSFILEPIYKLYTQVIGEEPNLLWNTLATLGIELSREQLKLDTVPLLKLVLSSFFGKSTSIMDSMEKHLSSPLEGARRCLENYARVSSTPSTTISAIHSCSSDGPLVVQITKLFVREDGKTFDAFGRVMSGTIRSGQRIKVLGENYEAEDEEDSVVRDVEGLWISQARYRIQMDEVPAGNLVLIGGVEESISKSATIVDGKERVPSVTFKPLSFMSPSVIKIAVEPLNPSELPKMLDGLRKVSRSYPGAITKAEESGEHIILGSGELYLDCIMHDLRKMFAEIEVKVADPVVRFCETVVETSSIKCFASAPNKQNKITMISEPLDSKIALDIEASRIQIDDGEAAVSAFFREQHGWDILESRSVWAFGPSNTGPNVLVNDTLPMDIQAPLLSSVKNSIVHGFQWATREGPLCEEPIRNVKFKILDAVVAPEPIQRGGGQIIPTARRVAYSAFLTATPRLMEPIYLVDIQGPEECVLSVYKVLSRRRGHIASEAPIPGTPLYSVSSYLPAIESFGFETDLRCHTQGQVFCQSVFSHWDMVPGDPLDSTIVLKPLQPSPVSDLARDFLVKTRRRKGLTVEINPKQYFDEEMRAYFEEAISME